MIFHLAPTALLLTALKWNLDRSPGDHTRALIVVLVVAVVETVFHTADALSGPDRRLALFVVPQLFIFGVAQLLFLRRYGFAAMLSFRLGYYLVWHVIWGHIRLSLLF